MQGMVKYYKKQAYITGGNLYNTLVSNPQGSYLGSKNVSSVPNRHTLGTFTIPWFQMLSVSYLGSKNVPSVSNRHTVGNLYTTLVPNPQGSYLGSKNVSSAPNRHTVGNHYNTVVPNPQGLLPWFQERSFSS
jgi:hypothetical protein